MEKQKTFEVQPSCKWIDWAQLQWRSCRVSFMAKARANCLPPKLLLLVVWLFNGSSSLASSLTGECVAIISIAIKLTIEYSLYEYIVVISIKGQQGQPSQVESRPGNHLQLLLLLLLCLSAGCKPHNHLPLKNSCPLSKGQPAALLQIAAKSLHLLWPRVTPTSSKVLGLLQAGQCRPTLPLPLSLCLSWGASSWLVFYALRFNRVNRFTQLSFKSRLAVCKHTTKEKTHTTHTTHTSHLTHNRLMFLLD